MNNDMLGRFLNGDANEEEFKQCETLLEDGNTIVERHPLAEPDPLVAALLAGPIPQSYDNGDTGELMQRIEGFAARQSIGRDDLERLLDAPEQPEDLGRIGKYRIIEFMAAGGMGLVFKAEDADLNRLVCIKIMQPALALKPEAKLRFQRESRAAAQLRSERIVTLLDIGVQRDLPYIVMQLLDGESLRTKLSREGKLSPALAVHYITQMAEGLRHAHAMGILHRDIKPDNIWVTPEGDIKLLDFGLARPLDEAGNLTTTGGLIGTPQYMSPEQIQGQTLDERTDLFSVGVVLFEMLSGSLPFQKNNLFSTMIAITNDSVHLPPSNYSSEIVPELETIMQSLLKIDSNRRIQSAHALMEQLSALNSRRPESTASVFPQASSANPRNSNFWRLPYVLAGLFGGLSAMLLGILVMQTTDRGTLVVQTEDPQVEVQIAKEKVTIKDPLSGRHFEVQIGKTTLPGGVYQLEMNDATSGLTFSSSTVAIRRGETVIVQVELRPQPRSTVSPSAENGVLTPTPGNANLVEVNKNADPSFDSKAREDFAGVLKQLPALPVDSDAAAMAVDSDETPSDAQQKLAGIDSWSIDSNVIPNGLGRNSDGTLFAAPHGNSIQIWDKSLQLKYTLRTSKRGFARFDNKFPNLIAVSSYIKGPNDLGTPEELNYELTIWRLEDNYAEIIYRIPCGRYDFAWDQGYRLFHATLNGVAAFRLDQGKSYELPGAAGMLLENAVSTSGRYLATQNNQNIDIWDLKRGEFAFTALSTRRAQWNQQGDRVAFFADPRPAFEIWDLEKRSIDDKVELPAEPVSSDRTGRVTSTAIGLEPTFQRIAWLSPQGKLNVRNLQTNREDSLALPIGSNFNIREAVLRWEGSSFTVETDKSFFVWTHQKSDVQGTLMEQEPSIFSQMKQGTPLDFHRALGSNTPLLAWNDLGASERNRDRVNGPDREELYFDAFDIASNKFFREAPLKRNSNWNYSNSRLFGQIIGPPFFSHDGKFAMGSLPIPQQGIPQQGTSRGRGEALFYSLIDTAPPTIVKADGSNVLWDKTDRFAAFGGGFRSTEGPFGIYDTETNQIIDPQKFAQVTGTWVDVHSCKKGFLACLRMDQPTRPSAKYSGELRLWIIDPALQQAKESVAATKLLSKVVPVESISTTDDYLFVNTLGRVDTVEDPAIVRKVYRITLDEERPTIVECITVPVIDELFFSASGEYVMRVAHDAEVSVSTNSYLGITRALTTKGPSELFIARWSDISRSLGDVDTFENQPFNTKDWVTLTPFKQSSSLGRYRYFQECKWHTTIDVAMWREVSGYPRFFAADKGKLRTNLSLTGRELIASDNGWLKADLNEVKFFDFYGRTIGRLVFDRYLANLKPSNPRWILANGSMASQCSTVGLAISYLKGNRFFCESIDEFERKRPDIRLPRSDPILALEPGK